MRRIFRRFAEEPLSFSTFLPWLSLLPFSILYGWIQRLRRQFYRIGIFPSYRPPRPVISVGNLTLGGTGKTPIVDAITSYLLKCGERPAIISRGYGGQIKDGAVIVSSGDGQGPILTAQRCGDEPYLLARRNLQATVVVSRRRQDGIELAIKKCGATVIILDDGFQHLAVQRDLDILLFDSRRPLGNGSVFPAGLLREPVSAIRCADLMIVTRDRFFNSPMPLSSQNLLRCRYRLSPRLLSLDNQTSELSALQSRRCAAFAGIATPDTFFDGLRELGLHLVSTFPLDDHVEFNSDTLCRLGRAAGSADFYVTTEKDGVKLQSRDLPLPCYQALLEVEFLADFKLHDAIDNLLKRAC